MSYADPDYELSWDDTGMSVHCDQCGEVILTVEGDTSIQWRTIADRIRQHQQTC